MTDWDIFEVRPLEADDEYSIDAVAKTLAENDTQVWVSLRVRESGNWKDVDLIGVEVSALRYIMGPNGELVTDLPLPLDVVRNIPYSQLIARAQLWPSLEEQWGSEPVDYEKLRAEWPNGDVGAVCREVARLYNAAIIEGEPAQKTVQQAFGVSQSTAGRMISKARELGHIQVSSVVGRPRRKGSNDGEAKT